MKKYTFQVTTFSGDKQVQFIITVDHIDTAWQEAVNYCISSTLVQILASLTLIDIE